MNIFSRQSLALRSGLMTCGSVGQLPDDVHAQCPVWVNPQMSLQTEQLLAWKPFGAAVAGAIENIPMAAIDINMNAMCKDDRVIVPLPMFADACTGGAPANK